MKITSPRLVLSTIVVAQFLCTSLWFAGNAVLDGLIRDFHLSDRYLGHLTTAIQGGFIAGTLVFALFRIADRYSPSKIFLTCALFGSITNALMVLDGNNAFTLLLLRGITGFLLAGIYPVGMKIAADYFEAGLSKVLGWLVGALVAGTALPHLLRAIGSDLPWQSVLFGISILSATGGLLSGLFLGDGPFRKYGNNSSLNLSMHIFKLPALRRAAFGYFGHMWELYTFWAFVPVLIAAFGERNGSYLQNSLWSFLVIASGAVGCIYAGQRSLIIAKERIAVTALCVSGLCCLFVPVVFQIPLAWVFIVFLMLWGVTVVADSPMFSALIAEAAPAEIRGTAFTLTISIGFALTMVSIQLMNVLRESLAIEYLCILLAPGPAFGLYSMLKNERS